MDLDALHAASAVLKYVVGSRSLDARLLPLQEALAEALLAQPRQQRPVRWGGDAPLRAVGRRCLPLSRMRLILVVLLALVGRAPAEGES